MTIADIKKTMDTKMDQSIAALKSNLGKIRTGRANPALLDSVQVDYYGAMTPISQVANVSLLDARTISVQPWEKGMGAKIEKAIRESDLGLNPASMGDLIRVPMPPMSEERRKEMTKLARNEVGEAGESRMIGVDGEQLFERSDRFADIRVGQCKVKTEAPLGLAPSQEGVALGVSAGERHLDVAQVDVGIAEGAVKGKIVEGEVVEREAAG